MTTTKTENITLLPYSERVKLVRERLNGLRYPKTTPLKKPVKVAAAEQILREWQDKDNEHQEAQRMTHRKKLHAVQDALIVGDMQKAVQLLAALGA